MREKKTKTPTKQKRLGRGVSETLDKMSRVSLTEKVTFVSKLKV